MSTIKPVVLEYAVIDYRYYPPERHGPFRSRLHAEAAVVALLGQPLADPKIRARNPRGTLGVAIESREVEE